MTELALLGVCHVSDLYPNVKYKLELLEEKGGHSCRRIVYDLGEGALYRNLSQRSLFRSVWQLGRLLVGTLVVFLRYLSCRASRVYVAYPAVPLVVLLSLLPGRWRPRIFMDAFISLYDTVIIDRGLYSSDSLLARLLFGLERRAFGASESVIVDTVENAAYYSRMFDLPLEKFSVVPLSIPPLRIVGPVKERESGEFTCLFVGSLVPLHGIEVILEAAASLVACKDIRFVIVGDGQDRGKVERYLSDHNRGNLRWERGLYATDFLVREIASADLCLGIFGSGAKSQRVLPYKLYYYAALGKPFLTMRTPCLQRYFARAEQQALLCPGSGQPEDGLAACIRRLADNPERLAGLGQAAQQVFDQQLSSEYIAQELKRLLQ